MTGQILSGFFISLGKSSELPYDTKSPPGRRRILQSRILIHVGRKKEAVWKLRV